MNMTYEEMIEDAYQQLVCALPESFNKEERMLVEQAFLLARKAHASQTRKSGLPYILHPLAVALIVAREMRQ